MMFEIKSNRSTSSACIGPRPLRQSRVDSASDDRTAGTNETMAVQSTKEVTDQSEVIEQLGKKLVRQAHVIKRQKDAVNEYKLQMRAMHEEMEMQDERDSRRDEEYTELKQDYDRIKERTEQMQNLLSENIEEMTNLKQETERDAKSIMELEFNLQQKDATLKRIAKVSSKCM